MKKALLSGNFFKANLHTHTTISDGNYTPEEVKKFYKDNGYSILALTDHENMVDHSDLNDDDFLMITSYEADIADDKEESWIKRRVCHINFYSEDPHKTDMFPQKDKVYSAEGINEMIKFGTDNGYLSCYNHPKWSLESVDEFGKYSGMFAMEVFNTSCYIDGIYEYNLYEYDQMLRLGKRIFPVCADDAHIKAHMFGGFVMVNTDKLEYANVMNALKKGDFYASQGPTIDELWYEDNKICVKCSDAVEIHLGQVGRATRRIGSDGTPLNYGEFELREDDEYVRIEIFDKYGKFAATRAYFLDELR